MMKLMFANEADALAAIAQIKINNSIAEGMEWDKVTPLCLTGTYYIKKPFDEPGMVSVVDYTSETEDHQCTTSGCETCGYP